MSKPGNRKQRWQSSYNTSGFIFMIIAVGLFMAGGTAGVPLALIVLILAFMDFRDAKRGWKMLDKRPPWADRHDAIDKKWEKKKNEYKFKEE